MPTKRRKTGMRRIGRMTHAQKEHLICGGYLFAHHPAHEFVDEQQRRDTWAVHRDAILEAWDHPGRRPVAFWEYDAGPWRQYGESQADAVYQLLKAGQLAGCLFNGCVQIASELEQIEANWLHEVRVTISHAPRPERTICQALVTYGTPPWFYNLHAPQIIGEIKAERAQYRASLERPLAADNGKTHRE